ncbi:hypothetical protein PG994_004245 [Apiospora phragmitis]|uniref:CsbD-like domain-containing protein n=1 Tax=Apiospora phragmitis TaxID=2905665 RepID=A0ABR1VQ19_9PEZI
MTMATRRISSATSPPKGAASSTARPSPSRKPPRSWTTRAAPRPLRRPTSLPRRQEGGGSKEGSGLERGLGAVDKAAGKATGTVKGTIDTVDDALGGATRKVGEIIGEADETTEGAEDVKDGAEGADQNGNILGKLAGSQNLIGKELKATNEKGVLLGEDNAVLDQVDLAPEGTVDDRIQDETPEIPEAATPRSGSPPTRPTPRCATRELLVPIPLFM